MASLPSGAVFLLLVLLFFPHLAGAVSDLDVQIAAAALRTYHRGIFANALLASPLRYELGASSSNASYTLLAPPDESLSLLDLQSEGSDYVRALRRHVALGSFSIADIMGFPLGLSLRTLVSGADLEIGRKNGSDVVVTVAGIGICIPDVYLTSGISIHGIDGVLPAGSGGEEEDSTWEDGFWPVIGRPPSLPFYGPLLPEITSPAGAHTHSPPHTLGSLPSPQPPPPDATPYASGSLPPPPPARTPPAAPKRHNNHHHRSPRGSRNHPRQRRGSDGDHRRSGD